MVKEKNVGSTLESFLKEEGNYEEAQSTAVKRVISWQLREVTQKSTKKPKGLDISSEPL